VKLRRLSQISIIVLCILSIVSCGKKGAPTLKAFEKPMPVKEIRAVHREDEIIISWSYPASERAKIKGFYIEKAEIKSQEAGGIGQEFKSIAFLKSDVSQFIDKDFIVKKGYLYKIRVYSLMDVLSDDSPVIKVKPLPLPPIPEGLSYVITNDSIKIKWDWICNSFKYNIYKSYEKGKYPISPINIAPLSDTHFNDRIQTDRTVYYTVRALLDTDIKDEGYPSDELEVNPEAFIPSRPYNLKFVPSKQKVYLMWNENLETWVKGYRIYRKADYYGEFKLIGESTTPAFTDTEPLVSKTYYYITALGPKKESIPSEVVEVYPLVER
jgi:hypothetical protein